ncbi:Apolipoprotein D [Orchesella cincta]|uniref:Apolipoprotein D n=1 Tax=Orchesella cincta TaxID=48709 RepID=A0A1D2NIN4_ORCCI|nr:Apolipoprotein D [Orchesella cincta]
MISIFGLIIFSIHISQNNGQILIPGSCPNLGGMQDFDLNRYVGLWYEVEKYMFLPEIAGNCVYVRYKDHTNDTFRADIVQVEAITRKHVVSPSRGSIISNDGSAHIDLVVDVRVPLTFVTVKIDYPYYILDTDYENYVIKWSCRPGALGHNIQSMWVLSRSRNYLQETRNIVHDKLRELGLRPEYLLLLDNYNCPSPRESENELEEANPVMDSKTNEDMQNI